MLVEEDIFELEVAVDAVLLVDVCDCADKLGKYLLDLFDGKLAMSEEVIVEFLACRVCPLCQRTSLRIETGPLFLLSLPEQYSMTIQTRFSVTTTS